MKPEEIAQWVMDNRYPKSEHEKISDAEMYHFILDAVNEQLHKLSIGGPASAGVSDGEQLGNEVRGTRVCVCKRLSPLVEIINGVKHCAVCSKPLPKW